VAHQLLDSVDVQDGIRLLGVAVSGIAGEVQHELPLSLPIGAQPEPSAAVPVLADGADDHMSVPSPSSRYLPGADAEHIEWGRGWVQGSGLGRVSVRFETSATGPGPLRTLRLDDPALRAVDPLPYTPRPDTPVATADR
jgi:DNA polymerase-4